LIDARIEARYNADRVFGGPRGEDAQYMFGSVQDMETFLDENFVQVAENDPFSGPMSPIHFGSTTISGNYTTAYVYETEFRSSLDGGNVIVISMRERGYNAHTIDPLFLQPASGELRRGDQFNFRRRPEPQDGGSAGLVDPAPRPAWVPVFPGPRDITAEVFTNMEKGYEVRTYLYRMSYEEMERFQLDPNPLPPPWIEMLCDVSPETDFIHRFRNARAEDLRGFSTEHFIVSAETDRDLGRRQVIVAISLDPIRGTVWRLRKNNPVDFKPPEPVAPAVRRRGLRIS
jgi:hypothetical protein